MTWLRKILRSVLVRLRLQAHTILWIAGLVGLILLALGLGWAMGDMHTLIRKSREPVPPTLEERVLLATPSGWVEVEGGGHRADLGLEADGRDGGGRTSPFTPCLAEQET